jgi:hypothetical protein
MPHAGYGLGNDLIAWTKAYILGQETGARTLHPAWGNNPRRYGEYFGTFRWDWQLYRVLVRALPHIRFDEQSWRELGEPDFPRACARFAELNGLRQRQHYVVTVTGLWGAFAGFDCARNFVRAQLLGTRHTPANLYETAKSLPAGRLTVAIHVRRDDFRPGHPDTYEGAWNTSIPLAWYQAVCRNLVAGLGPHRLQFLVASDGPRQDVAALTDEFGAIFTSAAPYSVCSDLLTLAQADLLVASLSTYSMWAAFLSNARYIWFRPHLSVGTDGELFMSNMRKLGATPASPQEDGVVSGPSRGVAVDVDGHLDEALIGDLERVWALKNPANDLIWNGTLRPSTAAK